ncbi:hypothetical protein HMN09_00857900 [Mycena chlorophos]|uniref:Uncharacterized protein n=1 Tax=Mycena chlorophos TaxID=658473 RepID=A0A8H6STE5_MYCCL|nr:hypothetical protein HMN09_00857900 [Mycena chlorophos]
MTTLASLPSRIQAASSTGVPVRYAERATQRRNVASMSRETAVDAHVADVAASHSSPSSCVLAESAVGVLLALTAARAT